MKKINLNDFRGIKVDPNFKDIMVKHAEKCKKTLLSTSPKSGRPNRATPYSTGWTVEPFPKRKRYAIRIYNKTNWQLTHLLENGHFVTNLNSGLTWVSPRKHIYPAYLKMRDPYIRDMEKAKLNVDFI